VCRQSLGSLRFVEAGEQMKEKDRRAPAFSYQWSFIQSRGGARVMLLGDRYKPSSLLTSRGRPEVAAVCAPLTSIGVIRGQTYHSRV